MHTKESLSVRIYKLMRKKGHGKLVSGITAATVPVAVLGTFWYTLHTSINQNDYRNHDHQAVRIERTFWDYNKDGKYDKGITRMTFKDGCVQEEEIPDYAIGRTRKDYEKVYKNMKGIGSLDEMEETLTFK